jgi:hypothetical protein
MARKTYAVEPGWKQLPGSKRQFQNIKTGQIISRTAYDRDFGRLKQQGIRSPQKQAAMSAPDIRQSRPAPGRASQKSAGAMKLRSIDPLKSHYTRNIPIPFDVFYTGNAGEFTRDAERFRPEYDLAIYNISKNNKIADAGIVYDFFNERNGTTRPNTLVTSRNTKNDFQNEEGIPFDDMLQRLIEKMYPGDHILALSFHLIFYKKYVTKSQAKKRKLSTKKAKKK